MSILTEIQRPDIRRHLAELSDLDRWLRFGFHVSECALDRYVNEIDFTSDVAIGIHDARSNLAGFTHVAMDPAKRRAELGISVSPEYRRQGYAEGMLREALRVAADANLDWVYVCFRTSNLPMMRLARKAGFVIVTDGGEAIASRRVENAPPQNEWRAETGRPFAPCRARGADRHEAAGLL